MSFTHVLKQSVIVGGTEVSASNEYSGSQRISLSESVPDSSTDLQVNVAIDVSAVKSFYLKSDQAVTIETNSGSAADDTLTLVADEPYIWHTGSLDTFQLGTDVTALFITNASGEDATVELEAIVDATP